MAAKPKPNLVRHGGYVSFDFGRKKDEYGFKERKTLEVYVMIDAKYDVSDCGWGTDMLCKLLKEKVEKMGKRNVEVDECW